MLATMFAPTLRGPAMSLELIVGPPNSGRAGAVLDRFGAALERDPLLVVPTSDDVDRFERELCARARRRCSAAR